MKKTKKTSKTLKFCIGQLSINIGKGKYLGGLFFSFELLFYGRGYYRFRKEMRMLRRKLETQEKTE